MKQKNGPPSGMTVKGGGARRDRTADPLHAMQVLSQLSYGPVNSETRNLMNSRIAVNFISKPMIRYPAVGYSPALV
jgi:hypothetical protein